MTTETLFGIGNVVTATLSPWCQRLQVKCINISYGSECESDSVCTEPKDLQHCYSFITKRKITNADWTDTFKHCHSHPTLFEGYTAGKSLAQPKSKDNQQS